LLSLDFPFGRDAEMVSIKGKAIAGKSDGDEPDSFRFSNDAGKAALGAPAPSLRGASLGVNNDP
jgi:hypothetical protein